MWKWVFGWEYIVLSLKFSAVHLLLLMFVCDEIRSAKKINSVYIVLYILVIRLSQGKELYRAFDAWDEQQKKLLYSEIEDKWCWCWTRFKSSFNLYYTKKYFFHLLLVTHGELFWVCVLYFSYWIYLFLKDISCLALDFIMLSS